MKALLIGGLLGGILGAFTNIMSFPENINAQETITLMTPADVKQVQSETPIYPILSNADYKALFADTKKTANPKAKVYVIEYTDLECPFCQRFHSIGTIQTLKHSKQNWSRKINRPDGCRSMCWNCVGLMEKRVGPG